MLGHSVDAAFPSNYYVVGNTGRQCGKWALQFRTTEQKLCSFSWKRPLGRLAQAVVTISVGPKCEYFTHYHLTATEKQFLMEAVV